MIECHVGACENHICHTDVNEGPFCNLDKCEKTTEEIVELMKRQRKIPVYDLIPEEEKVYFEEFLVVCAVLIAFISSVLALSWWLS